MTPETFFENFAHLVDAPNGVQKLRELILQLAVRGKLVPQDLTDEPAVKLLERIRAEKARLVKEKKIRKADPLPPVTADEAPYELPQGWGWVKLGDISEIERGGSPRQSKTISLMPLMALIG
jgi:type I restriction enzyme, S subunit